MFSDKDFLKQQEKMKKNFFRIVIIATIFTILFYISVAVIFVTAVYLILSNIIH